MRRARAGERDDLLGGVHAVADHRLHAPRIRAASLSSPIPATTCGASTRLVLKPARLLDPRRHARSSARARRTRRRSAQQNCSRGLRVGEVVREVLEQEPREPARLFPQREAVEQQVRGARCPPTPSRRRARRGSVRRTPRSATDLLDLLAPSTPRARSIPRARAASAPRSIRASTSASERGGPSGCSHTSRSTFLATSRYHAAGPSLA